MSGYPTVTARPCLEMARRLGDWQIMRLAVQARRVIVLLLRYELGESWTDAIEKKRDD